MKTTLKLAIIDDEVDARSVLRSFLQSYCPDIEIIGEAHNVSSAVSLIRLSNPDIILLDIHLKEEIGFDILDKFNNPSFKIIFITAHDNYALKAFRYYALDYILKPIDPDLFIKAIDKAKTDIKNRQPVQPQIDAAVSSLKTKTFNKIALPSSEGVAFIDIHNILYLQADGNYCCFFTIKEEKMMVTKTLKDFEQVLPEEFFFRTHQSYIVNIQFVKKVLKEDGGYALL